MKKFFKSIIAIVLCLFTLVVFTACDDGPWSSTTTDTSKVEANGGISVYHDGWIYFVNGTKAVSQSNVEGSVVQGGIYRVKTVSTTDHKIKYKEVEGKDGTKEKVFDTIELVVDRLVGYKNGSINIIGDYLYYTTPSRDKDKSGNMLTSYTEFRRYDLVNKKDQLVYKVQESDETFEFAFYKETDRNLDLVIFEKKSKTLKSLRMGDKVSTVFVRENVESALFSDNYGVNTTSGSYADSYVYYTLSYDNNSAIKRGVRVYKVLVDGTEEKLISEGYDVSLLTINAGKLIYGYDSKVYFKTITSGRDTLAFEEDNIVCYKNYDDIIFLEEDNSVLVYDSNILRTISWNNGALDVQEIYEIKADSIDFIGVEGNYVYYLNNKVLYRCQYKGEGSRRPVQLSTTKFDSPSGFISAEYNNGYIYGMYTDTSKSLTYLYRVNIKTPAECDERDDNGVLKEVYAAEFIGVTE